MQKADETKHQPISYKYNPIILFQKVDATKQL
jgi:hypothetical protein